MLGLRTADPESRRQGCLARKQDNRRLIYGGREGLRSYLFQCFHPYGQSLSTSLPSNTPWVSDAHYHDIMYEARSVCTLQFLQL